MESTARVLEMPVQNKATMEQALREEGNGVIAKAEALVVSNDNQYLTAGESLKQIKGTAKKVLDYWAPIKKSAHEVWKGICEKEKSMTDPLTKAEGIVKQKMLTYQRKVEAEKRAAEEELKRKLAEEQEKALAEAIKADEEGDAIGSVMAMAQAEALETIRPTVHMEAPKVVGMSTRKTWKARIINEDKVPTKVNGMLVRPVDMSALNRLALMSKGTMKIDGVEFYQEESLGMRA